MDVHIQNIDLTLSLSQQNKYANIEQDIHRRFQEIVLKPLEESMSKISENSINILIDSITNERDLASLSDLDNYLIELRNKIETKIQSKIKKAVVGKLEPIQIGTISEKKEILILYLKNGIISIPFSAQEIQKIEFEKLYKELKKANFKWSFESIIRLKELFPIDKIVSIIADDISNERAIKKEIVEYWQLDKNDTLPVKAGMGPVFDFLRLVFSIVKKKYGVTKMIYENSSLINLLKLAGATVDKESVRPYRPFNDGTRKGKKSIEPLGHQSVKKIIEEFQEGTSIYIQNAGLFILHPFLSIFFDNQGIYENNAISNCEKALSLLHFLATGNNGTPMNYELSTEKIILGLQPKDTFLISQELSLKEMNDCDELLNAVIKNWGVLGNTSPEGLRQLFIHRDGKCTFQNGKLKITLNRMAQDILLDQLPWGLGIIKLPWVENLIELTNK